MKYKVGDEVFVRCKIINVYPGSTVPYEVISANCNSGFAKPLYIAVRDDDIEDMTAEEARDIAKKLFADYSDRELDEIFGKGWSYQNLMKLTPWQAKAKIEAWEAEKEIKVGDVIFITYNQSINGVVTNIYGKDEKKLYVLWDDGSSGILSYTKSIKKTGRHIDIEGLLRKIGGADE